MAEYQVFWNGPQAIPLQDPKTRKYLTSLVQTQILSDPEYQDKAKDIMENTLPMLSEVTGITIKLKDGTSKILDISDNLRKKIDKIFNGTASLDPADPIQNQESSFDPRKEAMEDIRKTEERLFSSSLTKNNEGFSSPNLSTRQRLEHALRQQPSANNQSPSLSHLYEKEPDNISDDEKYPASPDSSPRIRRPLRKFSKKKRSPVLSPINTSDLNKDVPSDSESSDNEGYVTARSSPSPLPNPLFKRVKLKKD